ncbi:hypothetical protein Bealeia1_01246 [Candidatus Bealeia paramacronuclearis]|uniref:Uncharacterized protein n=1 Tax=Candidatus Bealeia paramacronuclearis TaxID=1921001 RepID=A0ABZ2C8M2_9PROT|nr:hypothetical protein [Candidatus Bealeia paramacronuclearis]
MPTLTSIFAVGATLLAGIFHPSSEGIQDAMRKASETTSLTDLSGHSISSGEGGFSLASFQNPKTGVGSAFKGFAPSLAKTAPQHNIGPEHSLKGSPRPEVRGDINLFQDKVATQDNQSLGATSTSALTNLSKPNHILLKLRMVLYS